MSDFLCFRVPGKPQGKQRARRGRNGRFYTPAETVAYERRVAWAAKQAMTKPMGDYRGPVVLSVLCYFGDHRRRDGDNVLKAVADSLNGVAYHDDSQVTDARVRVMYGDPRTTVLVRWGR